jgi:hypothetical protein
VKVDPMHLLARVGEHLPLRHSALSTYSHWIAQSLFLCNQKEFDAASEVAAKKFPGLSFARVLQVQRAWVLRRVRRTIPSGDVVAPRMERVFQLFGSMVDTKSKQPLFNRAAWRAAEEAMRTVRAGWLEDPPGMPLYSLLRHDSAGLLVYLCCRGTSANEGAVHQKLVRVLLLLSNVAAEMLNRCILDWSHRANTRAGARNRGLPFVGHDDVGAVDALQILEEAVYGVRGGVSLAGWRRAPTMALPTFSCGVVRLPEPRIVSSGLPYGGGVVAALEPVLARLSAQKIWVSKSLGAGVPLPPAHTDSEVALFGRVVTGLAAERMVLCQRRLRYADASTRRPWQCGPQMRRPCRVCSSAVRRGGGILSLMPPARRLPSSSSASK